MWSGSWCKKKQAEFASTEILVLLVLIFKSSGSWCKKKQAEFASTEILVLLVLLVTLFNTL